jgi:sulfonate transport system permease protein
MFWLETMMGAMLIIGIVGFAFDRIMALLEARLQRWRVA